MSNPPLAWGVGTKQLGMGRVNTIVDRFYVVECRDRIQNRDCSLVKM